jgi:hypothetical protein
MSTVFTKGSIVQYTWGYGQTNQQFFEVIARTPKTVILRELKTKGVDKDGNPKEYGYKDGWGYCVPDKKNYMDDKEPFRKRVFEDNPGEEELHGEFGWMGMWDGKPQRESWYY